MFFKGLAIQNYRCICNVFQHLCGMLVQICRLYLSVSHTTILFVSPTCFLIAWVFKITGAFAMLFNTSAVCLYKYVGCICSVSRASKLFVSPTCFLKARQFKITSAFAMFFNTSVVCLYKYVGCICSMSRTAKFFVSPT